MMEIAHIKEKKEEREREKNIKGKRIWTFWEKILVKRYKKFNKEEFISI